ncbi:hypothetical protein GA0111570_102223 [Raineyella antarctica]|uniref:Uncharacterized protein n=1 Tax=Raineyella antarctica TaxID=1577474 RepID=A0A1G6GF14_9ACTN|nr:hypothetical protein [Raineyella antarctica]SDB80433.1 hypothetical protein GA0111570_102223 [Raineyella antarctica]
MTNATFTAQQLTAGQQELAQKQAHYIEGLKAEGNPDLLQQVQTAATGTYGASGTLSIQSYLIYSVVRIDLEYTDSKKKVHFEGRAWGVGAGAVESFGGGPFVAPEVLVGDCGFHVQFGAASGGIAQVTCWRDNFGALGQITAAAIGAGATEMGGTGTWTWA